MTTAPPTRARGLIRDDKSYSRSTFPQLCKMRKLLGGPAGSANLAEHIPEILDQNMVRSCVTHAWAGACATSLAARGKPLGFTPSPKDLYRLCLAEDRRRGMPSVPASQLPPLRDRGTMLLTCNSVVQQWGVRARGADVFVNGVPYASDCSPANATKEPTLEAIERSKVMVGAYEIDADAPNTEVDVQLSLDAGNCVVMGGFLDGGFERYGSASPPLGPQNRSDPNGGGHATYLTGYWWDAVLHRWLYGGVNSWGKYWGKSGRFVCTGDFVRQMWELFSVNVEMKS
jgi:hypothetical protein